MRNIFAFCLVILMMQNMLAQDTIQKDFSTIFENYGVKGCFALYSQIDSQFIQYNAGYCDTGYIPASTFKIPHALIVLQEELILDTNQVIPWDGKEYPHASWNHDQNLVSAIQYSCVWAFTGFTNNISTDIYQSYVNQFSYGNMIIKGPPSMFWLAGRFRISANQQIDFLRNFYSYDLAIDDKHIDLVKEIIILEQTDGYILSGKTGSGYVTDDDIVMWMVGYIEKDGNSYFYALNFETNNAVKDRSARMDILKDVLRDLQLIE